MLKFIAALLFASPVLAQTPNHLLGEQSPYLQQHLYNAVDWYPWGPEALEKARVEGKPIFLSIGYSSCHWCHVMEQESFENAEIGEFLNENFVSIKIDRERRPDLDDQFMLVTQTIAGAGGWPNSVFLTSEAKPFFAGTYFPPGPFLDVLTQIKGLWRDERAALESEAEAVNATVQQYLNRTAAARELTPKLATAVARRMLMNFDDFNGGMGVAPKFPQETSYLFLLDQAERDQNREFLDAVLLTLDGMIMGGIHDQVGGGFHRYSVDPEWHVPHFEKMLYSQALIGRLLTRAARITDRSRYKRAAIRTFDYVLREMTSPLGGFYSAQDADSLTPAGALEEGVFYTWTPEEIREVLDDDAEFALDALNVTSMGNIEGSNSIHLTALPEDQDFYDMLDGVMERLYAARIQRPLPFSDEKIILSWNAAMIETLAEAAHTFDRPDYYIAAEKAAEFIFYNMLDDGDLQRISFQGSASVNGQLVDYAALGLAFIALHDYADDPAIAQLWLSRARDIMQSLTGKFSDDDGRFKMNQIPDGLGAFYPMDDSEIPGGNGMVLALLSRLAVRAEDPQYSRSATRLAAALSGHILGAPEQRAYSVNAAQIMTIGENAAVRYVANGVVRITSDFDRSSRKFTLDLQIKEGWHINAHIPLEDYFIPTDLMINGTSIGVDAFPDPLITSLSFNTEPLALYENEISLSADIPVTSDVASVILVLQACSDEICLAPEEVRFNIW